MCLSPKILSIVLEAIIMSFTSTLVCLIRTIDPLKSKSLRLTLLIRLAELLLLKMNLGLETFAKLEVLVLLHQI